MKLNVYSIGLLGISMVSSAVLGAADPMFYIKNKHYGDIYLELKQKGESVLGNVVKIEEKGEEIRAKLDRNTDIDVEIGYYTCKDAKKCEKNETPINYNLYKTKIKASPKKQTTVYVKFSDGKLMPQKGVRGKTENGRYSLENNITAADIKAR